MMPRIRPTVSNVFMAESFLQSSEKPLRFEDIRSDYCCHYYAYLACIHNRLAPIVRFLGFCYPVGSLWILLVFMLYMSHREPEQR